MDVVWFHSIDWVVFDLNPLGGDFWFQLNLYSISYRQPGDDRRGMMGLFVT